MDSPDVIEELSEKTQEIQCFGSDGQEGFTLYGDNVIVNPSDFDHQAENASNKIRVSQISKFEWEEKFYFGNLVSCNSTYMAYVLRPKASQEYHIRVINHHTSDRVLLRGFKNEILDICFESIRSNRFACVDSSGSVYVYNIYEVENSVKYSPVLRIINDRVSEKCSHRIVWAPSLLVPTYDYEPMLAVSSGCNVEVLHMKKLEVYTDEIVNRSEIIDGIIQVNNGHQDEISSLAISPDNNVLATASKDGFLKFWSLNFEDTAPPSCLHEWEPHNKEPVTSLFFCDNLLLGDDKSPFWRFLITGSANNSIFKIWCAVKWECVQTITFAPYGVSSGIEQPYMKAMLDISAKFFVVADVYKQVLYIMKLHQDNVKDRLSFVTLNEFILKESLLSFAIHVAKDKKQRSTSAEEGDAENHIMNGASFEEEDTNEHIVEERPAKTIVSMVTMFAIQKRALQKLSVKFKAVLPLELPVPSISTSSMEDATSIQDGLSDITDISESMSQSASVQLDEDNESSSSPIQMSLDSKSSFPVITSIDDNTIKPTDPMPNINDDKLVEVSTDISLVEKDDISSFESLPNELQKSVSEKPVAERFDSSDDFDKNDVIENHAINKRSHVDSLLLTNPIDSGVSLPEKKKDSPLEECSKQVTDEDSREISGDFMNQLKKQESTINCLQNELQEIKFLLRGIAAKQSSDTSSHSFNREQLESDRDELKVYMQLLQKSSQSNFSKASKEFSRMCTHKMEEFTQTLQSHSQAKEERTIQSLSNIVSNTIAIKLEKIVKHEIKQVILPTLEKAVNKHLEHTSSLMAQKISALERTMKEETQDLIKSKQFLESIGLVTANVLEKTIPNSYRESFQSVLIPGFEKASMSMFMQINQAFQQGTKQYLEKVEHHMDGRRSKLQDGQDPLLSSLQDLVHSFQGTADRLTSGVETNLEALMQKQLADTTDRMQNNFVKSIESRVLPILSQSISKCANDSFNTWRSKIDETLIQIMQGTARPLQPEESLESKKKRVIELIEGGDFTGAFELALTASSLQLVMYVCKQVDPTDLFQQESGGQLPQPIILSLVQQLSVNLNEETDIKKRYLEESIMALDKNNEITKEHMPSVLQSLNEQLSTTIETLSKSDGSSKRIKPLKMLLMASRSLIYDD